MLLCLAAMTARHPPAASFEGDAADDGVFHSGTRSARGGHCGKAVLLLDEYLLQKGEEGMHIAGGAHRPQACSNDAGVGDLSVWWTFLCTKRAGRVTVAVGGAYWGRQLTRLAAGG